MLSSSAVVPAPPHGNVAGRAQSVRPRFTGWIRGTRARSGLRAFHHEAVLDDGERSYLDRLLPFLRGARSREPMLVAVAPREDPARWPMPAAPTRPITFVADGRARPQPGAHHPGLADVRRRARRPAPVRGIGEPIWAGRSQASWTSATSTSRCSTSPSPTAVVPAAVPVRHERAARAVLAAGARRAIRALDEHGATDASDHYHPRLADRQPDGVPGEARRLAFDGPALAPVRRTVAEIGARARHRRRKVEACVIAVNEIAANSVRHGGGRGELHVWHEDDALVCEVRDAGCITDPLAGRHIPTIEQLGGRGLWMVNQLCDLVQIRTPPHAPVNTVRVWARA